MLGATGRAPLVPLKRAAAFAALVLWASVTCLRAEDVPIAEVRLMKDLGQVVVETSTFDRPSDLATKIAALEKKGIVVLESDAPRTFARTDRIGTHAIDTKIVLAAPVGHGEGGGSSEARLTMAVDGAVRVDCSLWSLDRIAIDPARKFVTLTGHSGIVRFDGFEPRKVVDDDWLDARAEETRRLIAGPRVPPSGAAR
jgi:hypothetical protein